MAISPYGSYGPLLGVYAKLWRASEHMKALKAKLQTVYADTQFSWFEHRDEWERVLIVDYPLDPAISTTAGDAIQNMRHALDHLVWDLVIRAQGKPGRHTQFPVSYSPKAFVEDSWRPNSKRKGKLHGLKPDSLEVTVIESVQPYHGREPQNTWIAMLNDFANLDKHRSLYWVAHWINDPQSVYETVGWNQGARILAQVVIDPPIIEGRTEVLRLTFDPDGPSPEVQVNGQFAVTPLFGGDQQVSYGAFDIWLSNLYVYVDQFQEFFPEYQLVKRT